MQPTGQFYGTGKRKTSRARVFLRPGTGLVTINGKSPDDYFPSLRQRLVIRKPFEVTAVGQGFDAIVTVVGGGVTGQADATCHGMARALLRFNPLLRPALKSHGLLTRDSREVERKIYGQPGSRKRFQFSKR